MLKIGERIKEIRKELGLSQEKFGDKICVTKAHVSKIELSDDMPSDMLIKLLCIEYCINEEWLRTGVGEKYSKSKPENGPVKGLKIIAGGAEEYEKKYQEMIGALGPGGATSDNIPLLKYPNLLDMVNYLQWRFSEAGDDIKEQLRIEIKFEEAFKDWKEKAVELNNTFHNKKVFHKVAEDQEEYSS